MTAKNKEGRPLPAGRVTALLFGACLAGAMPLHAAEASAASGVEITTTAHQIRIDPADGAITRWRTAAGTELASRFDATVTSRHLRLLAGSDSLAVRPLAFDAVFERETASGRELGMQARVGPVKIIRTLHVPESGPVLRLVLAFVNESDASVTLRGPVAGPALVLGPGLGAENVSYEGVAASMYDFLDVVFMPAEGDQAGVLALDEESGAQQAGSAVAWAGLNTRYRLLAVAVPGEQPFASARLEPDAGLAERLNAGGRNPQHAGTLSLDLPVLPLEAGESRTLAFEVYAGVKDAAQLSTPDGTDFTPVLFNSLWNWMRALCFGLLWVMTAINGLVGNLGVTILLLAVAVRLLLYPLGKAAARQQLRFNQKQAELAPELERIKATYRGGEQAEHIFELYRRHGVSPAAGVKSLLVVLIQIPVFIALFHILGQAVQFSGAPFLWIDDLARPDELFTLPVSLPYFGSAVNLLPVLMAAVSLAAMGMNRPGDESRAQFFFLIAVNAGFFLLFYHFPAGMVLYWTMANLLHLLQHLLVKSSRDTGEAAA